MTLTTQALPLVRCMQETTPHDGGGEVVLAILAIGIGLYWMAVWFDPAGQPDRQEQRRRNEKRNDRMESRALCPDSSGGHGMKLYDGAVVAPVLVVVMVLSNSPGPAASAAVAASAAASTSGGTGRWVTVVILIVVILGLLWLSVRSPRSQEPYALDPGRHAATHPQREQARPWWRLPIWQITLPGLILCAGSLICGVASDDVAQLFFLTVVGSFLCLAGAFLADSPTGGSSKGGAERAGNADPPAPSTEKTAGDDVTL